MDDLGGGCDDPAAGDAAPVDGGGLLPGADAGEAGGGGTGGLAVEFVCGDGEDGGATAAAGASAGADFFHFMYASAAPVPAATTTSTPAICNSRIARF